MPTYLPSTRNQPSKASSLRTPQLVNRSLGIPSCRHYPRPLHPLDEISPSYDVVLTSLQPHHNSGVTTSRPLADQDGIPLPSVGASQSFINSARFHPKPSQSKSPEIFLRKKDFLENI